MPTFSPRRVFCMVLLLLLPIWLARTTTTGTSAAPGAPSTANCSGTSVNLTPLNDLGSGTYQSYSGGLYPNASNIMPTAHLSDGLALAQQIRPRDASGQPNRAGKIVLLSIGMSNTSQEYTAFITTATNDSSRNPALVLVNGAQGGMTAARIQNPNDGGSGTTFWQTVDTRLNNASVTREQVQVVWLKEADASPSGSDISYAQTLASELQTILRVLHDRFPNLKLTYLSSRSYAGYASITLNPEPYAYASGFAVKWTIERQLSGASDLNYDPAQGAVVAPWIAWGPYFWADGTKARSDGLTWLCSDFNQFEGTHPSSAGAAKIANMLLTFFKTDATSQPWFRGSSDIYLPLISKQ